MTGRCEDFRRRPANVPLGHGTECLVQFGWIDSQLTAPAERERHAIDVLGENVLGKMLIEQERCQLLTGGGDLEWPQLRREGFRDHGLDAQNA